MKRLFVTCLVYLALELSGHGMGQASDYNCDVTTTIRPPTETATTDAASEYCSRFSDRTSHFSKTCAPRLSVRIVEQMKKDCEMFSRRGADALQDFADNIARICEMKGAPTSTVKPPTTPLCFCASVVFLIDASNSVAPHYDKSVQFVKKVMAAMASTMVISASCTQFGMIRFSDGVEGHVSPGETYDLAELSDLADNLGGDGEFGKTNTHHAIDKFNEMIMSNDSCPEIGVLISHGKVTNWNAAIESMIYLYEFNPDVKMIVVSVDSDDQREDEVYGIATGRAGTNVVQVPTFNHLKEETANVINLILAPNGVQGCTQYAVINAGEKCVGWALTGIYEVDGSGTQCAGCNAYMSTKYYLTNTQPADFTMYMAVVHLGVNRWVIIINDPTDPNGVLDCSTPNCKPNGAVLAFANDETLCVDCRPDAQLWRKLAFENGKSIGYQFSAMDIKCYN